MNEEKQYSIIPCINIVSIYLLLLCISLKTVLLASVAKVCHDIEKCTSDKENVYFFI